MVRSQRFRFLRPARFSLRALLTVLTMSCVGAAVVKHIRTRGNENRLFLKGLVARGAKVTFAHECDAEARLIYGQPGSFDWITRICGVDYTSIPVILTSSANALPTCDYKTRRHLSQLVRLVITGGAFSDERLKCLTQLHHLRYLTVNNVTLSNRDLEKLCRLSALEGLTVWDCGLSDEQGLQHLEKLKSLCSLRLNRVGVCGQLPNGLASLARLDVLDLRETNFDDEGLGKLSIEGSLRELRLDGTLVTGAGLKHLGRFRKLQSLSLGCTRIDDKGLRAYPITLAVRKATMAN